MLKAKTALITGASRGIGRAIALELARQGADCALLYAGNHAAAEQTAEQIAQLGVRVRAWQCDVCDFNACADTVRQVLAHFGAIDILVNNAGITIDRLLVQMSEADFDRVLDTNLKGAFHMTRHVGMHFIRRRAGRIINITSVAGIMGNAGQANYSAAKAGMIGLTKATAREMAARGITCNAIAPGFIATDMTDALPERAKEAALGAIPLKRMGAPEDVAHLAAFLAGDGAAYITGTVIRVDGGLCM